MESTKPKFTIGICSSERPDYLKEAIKSALTQSYNYPYQIIIADDSSTNFDINELVSMIKSNIGKDKLNIEITIAPPLSTEVKINLESSVKAGEAAMRNRIISHTNSEYIIWLDDDDILLPDTLSDYNILIQNSLGYDIFYGNLIRTDEKLIPEREYTYRDIGNTLMLPTLLLGSVIPNGGSCISTRVFKQIGIYDTSFEVATDYQFWARAALSGVQFKHMPKSIYLYRSHKNNAALDKEDERFFKTNARVAELILTNTRPNHLFPFFEWKKDEALANIQVLLACMILACRNRDSLLLENGRNKILSEEPLHKYLKDETISKVFDQLVSCPKIGFDETTELFGLIIQAGNSYNSSEIRNTK